jgi:hypothetical protein
MAYVYLLELYKHIAARQGEAAARDNADDDGPAAQFARGRIDALAEFEAFLKTNFNPKLPRRIRESLTKT